MVQTIYVLQSALKTSNEEWSEVEWRNVYAVKDPIKELGTIQEQIEERRKRDTQVKIYYRLRRIELYDE